MHEISSMSKNLKLIGIALLFVVAIGIGVWIKNVIDNKSYETAKLYNTAIQADTGDVFNYAIDSRQGNVLGSGIFTAKTPIGIEDISGTYTRIVKTKERYTQHTRTYECGTEDVPQTCTQTYYTWDYAGHDVYQVPTVVLYDREYSADLFDIKSSRRLGCDVILQHCKNSYRYEDDGWFTSVGDVRWYYSVKDTSFFGTILVNTSEGTLKPISGFTIEIADHDIPTAIKHANQIYGGIIFLSLWILFAVVMCVALIRMYVLENI